VRRRAPALLLALGVLLVFAQPAWAQFGFAPGGVSFRILDSEGKPDDRAGAHPSKLEVEFAFNSQGETAEGVAKNLVVELPPGLLGDPTATPTCSREDFDSKKFFGEEICPEESRVGTLALRIAGFGEQELALFNVEPAPGEFATFGATLAGKIAMQVKLRPGDLGATLETDALLQDAPVLSGRIELWGVPADHQQETAIARRPLLISPTRCDAPLAITLRANSWEAPSEWDSATAVGEGPLQGCGELPYAPVTSVGLDNPVTDSPTGTAVDVVMPADEAPESRIGSETRSLQLALPAGFSLSAPGANGLATCSEAQLALESADPARCPGASRVGSVEMETPLLREPLQGTIFVGQKIAAGQFRLFVVALGPGIEAKFAGTMQLDPATGRVSARLDGLPQIPLRRIHLSFDGGPYALLATPPGCGAAVTTIGFDPYAGGGTVQNTAATTIGAGAHSCGALPFHPSLLAGSSTVAAGRFAGFSALLERQDGEQPLGQLSLTFPPGLTAVLRSVAQCPAPQAAAGSCPAASRVGSSVLELGPGPSPIALRGDAYFTGPFRGSPFGIALAFHGPLGPFEVGPVVVRGGLDVDPLTGRLTLETEKLPQLEEGIPLRIRQMRIAIDRRGFIRNPSSCAPELVEATLRSASRSQASASSPFQVKACHKLGFKPKIAVTAIPAPAAAPAKPGLKVQIGGLAGGANLRSLQMRLPPVLGFSLGSISELCSRQQALAGRCPGGSVVGSASARSPLLAKPMKGPVFLAQPAGDGLPEFWVELKGGGIGFDLGAKTVVSGGQLETRLERIPDVPFSRLSLRFASGKDGVFTARRSLCGSRRSAPQGTFSFLAQNYALRVEHRAIGKGRACGRA
jgi:hypothetical protein